MGSLVVQAMMPETERRLIPTTERRIHEHRDAAYKSGPCNCGNKFIHPDSCSVWQACSTLVDGYPTGNYDLAFFDCPCGMVTWMYAHPLWTERLAKRVGE